MVTIPPGSSLNQVKTLDPSCFLWFFFFAICAVVKGGYIFWQWCPKVELRILDLGLYPSNIPDSRLLFLVETWLCWVLPVKDRILTMFHQVTLALSPSFFFTKCWAQNLWPLFLQKLLWCVFCSFPRQKHTEVHFTGSDSALSLVLNVEQYECMRGPQTVAGLKVRVMGRSYTCAFLAISIGKRNQSA